MANVELVAHAATIVFYLWKQLVLLLTVKIELSFDMLAYIFSSGVYLEVYIEFHVYVHFQVFLLRHHLVQFLIFLLGRLFLEEGIEISV